MPYDPACHGPHRVVGPGFHARVWALVKQVPAGCVTTYGDVARRLGLERAARQVGFALAALPEDQAVDVPWHRVVNGGGGIAPRPSAGEQRRRLRAEGIPVTRDGHVRDFPSRRYKAWAPP
jgi:methylated-DNA-protein-cysteine methyltransferase-like protein